MRKERTEPRKNVEPYNVSTFDEIGWGVSMNKNYEKLMRCYESLREKVKFEPKVAIVLGSGLGDFADNIQIEEELPYGDIEGFPVSTVPGHAGKFIFGYLGKVPVVCMKGRVHYYEGYPIGDVVLPTRLMKMMGAEILFLTNAAGGVNYNFHAGDFIKVNDLMQVFLLEPRQVLLPEAQVRGKHFPPLSFLKEYKIPI